MAKKKEPNYAVFFVASMVVALIAHYFLLANTTLHPTLQVFISFIIFIVVIGFSIIILEKK